MRRRAPQSWVREKTSRVADNGKGRTIAVKDPNKWVRKKREKKEHVGSLSAKRGKARVRRSGEGKRWMLGT